MAVRTSRAVLADDLPGGNFEYLTTLLVDEYAFLEWRGQAAEVRVEDGADSFVISDGRIVMQSIHYTVRHRTGYHRHVGHAKREERAPMPVAPHAVALMARDETGDHGDGGSGR